MTPRIPVITGIGAVAPGGVGAAAFWRLLVEGRTATRATSLFDAGPFRSKVAAEVDFDPVRHGLTPEQAARLDRMSQFALVAAREALHDSGFAYDRPERTGVVLGSAVGATTSLERHYRAAGADGRRWLVDESRLPAEQYDYLVPSSVVREVAWLADAQGPAALISTGCTAGIDAVAHAGRLIADASADVVVAGAADAPLSPITAASFDAIRATTDANDDPEHASRPFDLQRRGFVLGEGAAVFVLEELTAARRRGAHIYCAIAGAAAYTNAYHMTGLRSDGTEMARAITTAMDRAKIDATRIDYVNAHGSGTKQNDRHETAALKRSLGPWAYRIPVSSIKSMIGHSLGAIGSLEIAACALALRHQAVPPTANLRTPDPECDLDYVPGAARERRLDVVLTVGSGFGGFQSAMVLATADRSGR
jgi:act minimal PKS ketosynthase (KS/KS alpha)